MASRVASFTAKTMGNYHKEKISNLVKAGRASKGYTQRELSEIIGVSLRSIQRIENADVLPRAYTLKLLSQHLGFPPDIWHENNPTPGKTLAKQSGLESFHFNASDRRQLNHRQRLILTFGIGILLTLLLAAFLTQSSVFPETDFEFLLLLTGTICLYTLILLFIWK